MSDTTGKAASNSPTNPSSPSEAEIVSPPGRRDISVHLHIDSVQINENSLQALVRLSEANPDLAIKLVERAGDSMRVSERKFQWGTITGLVLGLAIIICSTAIVITTGFWAGIGFFLSVLVVAVIFSVVLNQHFPDLSWLKGILPSYRPPDER